MLNQLVRSLLKLVIGGVLSWYISPRFLQGLRDLYQINPEWLLTAFRLAFFTFVIMFLDSFRRWTGEKAISHTVAEFLSCSTPKAKSLPELEVQQIIIYHISFCSINDYLEIIYHIKSTGSTLLTKSLFFGSSEEIRSRFIPDTVTLTELLHAFRYLVLDITNPAKVTEVPAILAKKPGENRIRLTFCLNPPIGLDKEREREEAYVYVRLRRPTLWNTLREFGEDDECAFDFSLLPPSKAIFLFYVPRFVRKSIIKCEGKKYMQDKNFIKFTIPGPVLGRISYGIYCPDFKKWYIKLLRYTYTPIYVIWDAIAYHIPPFSAWITKTIVRRRLKHLQPLIQDELGGPVKNIRP